MFPPIDWIPNGAYPCGIVGSVKPPAGVTSWKLPLKTSTRALRKSAAKSSSPEIARPLKTALLDERSTATIAWVGETVRFQPRIFPSSVAKRNNAGPDAVLLETTKLEPGLATAPVGAEGTPTTIGEAVGKAVPSAWYTVVLSVPLSATHHGEAGSAVRPQALTRFGSSLSATPVWSETRLCTT